MYSMLNAQMIQASHADRSQDALMAGHLRELRELRRTSPRRRHLRRIAAASAAVVLIGGTSDALAATSTHSGAGSHSRTSRTSRTFGTSRTSANDWRFFRRG